MNAHYVSARCESALCTMHYVNAMRDIEEVTQNIGLDNHTCKGFVETSDIPRAKNIVI